MQNGAYYCQKAINLQTQEEVYAACVDDRGGMEPRSALVCETVNGVPVPDGQQCYYMYNYAYGYSEIGGSQGTVTTNGHSSEQCTWNPGATANCETERDEYWWYTDPNDPVCHSHSGNIVVVPVGQATDPPEEACP